MLSSLFDLRLSLVYHTEHPLLCITWWPWCGASFRSVWSSWDFWTYWNAWLLWCRRVHALKAYAPCLLMFFYLLYIRVYVRIPKVEYLMSSWMNYRSSHYKKFYIYPFNTYSSFVACSMVSRSHQVILRVMSFVWLTCDCFVYSLTEMRNVCRHDLT